MESKSRKIFGAIIAAGAIGISILNYVNSEDLDAYLMPFILLWLSVIIFLPKTKQEKKQKEISKKTQRIILSIVSVALVTGIIAFCVTLL